MVTKHPLSVFAYATKHDYADIMSQAAPLVLDEPIGNITAKLPREFLAPWVSRTCRPGISFMF
jgi:hypothetical protein